MIYLGFDMGNNFGFAVLNKQGHRLESGTLTLRNNTWEGGGIRYWRMRAQIITLFKRHRILDHDCYGSPKPGQVLELFQDRIADGTDHLLNPAIVTYEQVFQKQKSGTAAAVYYGCVATLTAVCEEFGVPYEPVPVATLKKTATGRGNASKADMMDACVKHWKHDPNDDNEADALWSAEHGRRKHA